MSPGFELFDHTADLGIRVFAPRLSELIIPATRGLYSVIGELSPTGEPLPFSFDSTGDEPAILLRDYLTELLLVFERDHHFVPDPMVAEFSPDRLSVTGRCFPVDERQSVYYREVKAITYHELAIRQTADGVEARIIVDI